MAFTASSLEAPAFPFRIKGCRSLASTFLAGAECRGGARDQGRPRSAGPTDCNPGRHVRSPRTRDPITWNPLACACDLQRWCSTGAECRVWCARLSMLFGVDRPPLQAPFGRRRLVTMELQHTRIRLASGGQEPVRLFGDRKNPKSIFSQKYF